MRALLERAVGMEVQLASDELGITMVEGHGGPAKPARADSLFRGGHQSGDAVAAINLAWPLNNPALQGRARR